MNHYSSIIKSALKITACLILFFGVKNKIIEISSILFFLAEGVNIVEYIYSDHKLMEKK